MDTLERQLFRMILLIAQVFKNIQLFLYLKKLKSVVVWAAGNGNLGKLKWLKEKGCTHNVHTFERAARHGNLEIMIWLKRNGCPWEVYTFERAAGHGSLENMMWLQENGCPWSSCTFTASVMNVNPKDLDWLKKKDCPWDKYALDCGSTIYPHVRILIWLLDNGFYLPR